MVHGRPEVSRLEEVHAVQVGDVHPPLVGLWAVRAVLLDVHAEKTDLGAVDVLEGEQGLHPVREGLGHLAVVHEPASERNTAISLSAIFNFNSGVTTKYWNKASAISLARWF